LKLSGRLEVGGRVSASEEITARDIEIGGTVRARKITAEERVEVGGSITTSGGVTARTVEIGRRGEVHGPIKADKVFIERDAHAENVYGKEILLRTGASANDIFGQRVTIESYCHVTGEVQYTEELRVGEKVSLSKQPQKVEKLPF